MHGLRNGALAVLAVLGAQVLAARGSRLAPLMLVATVALDLSGRAAVVFNVRFTGDKIGTFDTQLVEEFLRRFAATAVRAGLRRGRGAGAARAGASNRSLRRR